MSATAFVDQRHETLIEIIKSIVTSDKIIDHEYGRCVFCGAENEVEWHGDSPRSVLEHEESCEVTRLKDILHSLGSI